LIPAADGKLQRDCILGCWGLLGRLPPTRCPLRSTVGRADARTWQRAASPLLDRRTIALPLTELRLARRNCLNLKGAIAIKLVAAPRYQFPEAR
jgi:hypothetical protein